MAAAKPSRTAKPSARAAAKPSVKATPRGASKPAAKATARTASKPSAKAAAKATGKGPDEQVRVLQKAARQIQTQGDVKKAQRHQEMVVKRFNRGIRVAELRHAKQMGLEHGRAKVEGSTVGQRQQQQAAGSTQGGANQAR